MYWILYFLNKIALFHKIEISYSNINSIWDLYPKVINIINVLIEKERNFLSKRNEEYSHPIFFKYNKPKKYFENLDENELARIINK